MRLIRHESPGMRFELAFAAPVSTLRKYVREYVGWVDYSGTPVTRRELPSGIVPLIINFGATVRERKAGSDQWNAYGTFTAGVHEAFTIVESAGPNVGIQVNFTAMGARLFYDRPLAELTNRTVELTDVFGRSAERLISQLHEAPSWEERFAILDREIGSRIGSARRPARVIEWAWEELLCTRGRARIADLVREVGWSERHFAVQFRDQMGLAPKALARVLRFAHAVRSLTTDRSPSLADVAQICGYYDQAHFTRDFRAFAGTTPTALMDSRLPERAGFGAAG